MEFLEYSGAVFTPWSMLILVVGTVGGLILGATPGLSPTMAVALLIPFTFKMEPAHGLILLGAAYTSSVAGGAISAILLKIPGAPANIATALDGFAMAQKGEAAKALQMCFLSSTFGGVIGIFVLIFLTPVLAAWALKFGPSHLFWIAIFGVTIIATLDSKSVVKGLLSGCIGLWISTIGFDSIQGVERFTFTEHLDGGVHLIAALIGLFAIPQIVEMLETGRNKKDVTLMKTSHHSVWASVREVFGKVRALSIGSVVGVFIGLIPGAGGQIAGIVSYDQTRKFSPNREAFGTGESEGVVAAESANNAMVGPSLVPLLTMSIPGSPTAAVLLGGLLIHGIFPGPDLFTIHADVAWTFINSMLVGQILMLLFGLYIARLAARIVLIPPPFLAAGILILAVFGSYSVQHSLSDVFVMFTLGLGAYFLEKFEFTATPMVLGIILGPIAEANYIQGRIIAQVGDGMASYFLAGTLNITLYILCLASIAYSVAMEIRSGGQTAPSGAIRRSETKMNGLQNILKRRANVFPLGLVLAFSLWIAFVSFNVEDPMPYLFPRLISVALVALSVLALVRCLQGKEQSNQTVTTKLIKNVSAGIAVMFVFVFFAAEFLGFYTASALAFLAIVTFYDPAPHAELRAWVKRVSAMIGFLAVMYGLFTLLLKVQIPQGLLI